MSARLVKKMFLLFSFIPFSHFNYFASSSLQVDFQRLTVAGTLEQKKKKNTGAKISRVVSVLN